MQHESGWQLRMKIEAQLFKRAAAPRGSGIKLEMERKDVVSLGIALLFYTGERDRSQVNILCCNESADR